MSIQSTEYPYPLNLVFSVLGHELPAEELPYDFEQSVEYVLSSLLTCRERTVLRLYYRRDMTNAEIGQYVGLDAQHIRQILLRARLKLRRPSRRDYLLFGCAEMERRLEAQRPTPPRSKLQILQETCSSAPLHEMSDPKERIDAIMARSGLESMYSLPLSTRAFHCLHRLNATQIWQICFLTPEDILSAPGFGPMTCRNIEEQLEPLGLALDDGVLSADEILWELAQRRFEELSEAPAE